jgi:hypothetical protein
MHFIYLTYFLRIRIAGRNVVLYQLNNQTNVRDLPKHRNYQVGEHHANACL